MKYNTTTALLAGASALAVPRAITGFGVRADASDPKVLFAELQRTVQEMRDANDARLKKVESKVDPLDTEKLNALNDQVGNLQAALDEQSTKLAALRLNGAPGDMEPTDPEYLSAFKAHMRKGDVQASMKVGTDAEGGYLAPVEWDRTITNKLKLLSPIRANAQVITISGRGFSRVYNDGVVGSGWVGETAVRPETTTPGLTTLTFNVGEIYANPAITQQALDDVAIDLEQWITDEVDGEFAIQENIAFLSGDGVNKPYGILGHVTGGALAARHPFGAITAVNAAALAAIASDDILNLVYDLPSERSGNAKFYMNRTTLGSLRKVKDTDGNYIWQPSYQAGEPSTLTGYPVVEVPGMPTRAASAIVALFGDMEATYLVVDRIGLRVLRDPYTNKPFVMFYTTKRVGGGVQNPEYMRALKMPAV